MSVRQQFALRAPVYICGPNVDRPSATAAEIASYFSTKKWLKGPNNESDYPAPDFTSSESRSISPHVVQSPKSSISEYPRDREELSLAPTSADKSTMTEDSHPDPVTDTEDTVATPAMDGDALVIHYFRDYEGDEAALASLTYNPEYIKTGVIYLPTHASLQTFKDRVLELVNSGLFGLDYAADGAVALKGCKIVKIDVEWNGILTFDVKNEIKEDEELHRILVAMERRGFTDQLAVYLKLEDSELEDDTANAV